MLKTHNTTGMKYLCFHNGTESSCIKYTGSGKYWKLHLKKHGVNVSTDILESSLDKEYISSKGLEYSKLWDVVKSDKFANLIVEDAQKSFSSIDYVKSGIDRKERIKKYGFTENEKQAHLKVSSRQLGKSMTERLNNPNYIDPRRGKTFKEIYNNNYIHPKLGKKRTDIPQDSKPFKLIVNDTNIEYYKSEKDFEDKTGMSRLMISKIKKKDYHIVKIQSNSNHKYNSGDILRVIPITIKEYKLLI